MSEIKTANLADPLPAIEEMAVFFDFFDYPLTRFELWDLLDRRLGFSELGRRLDACRFLEQRNGFYFLKGREKIVAERQKRHNYYRRKLEIARSFSCLFGAFPFVRAIFLANTIGYGNLRDGSDIDFFIISSPRRIWLTRLFCTGLAKLLNRRPTENDKRDKLCLSFYISSDRLGLDYLKLPGGDPYFDYWIRSLVLLYNMDRTAERFWSANPPGQVSTSAIPPISLVRLNPFLDKVEGAARRWQEKIMPLAIKETAQRPLAAGANGVVMNEQAIKLYLRDRRQEIKDRIIIHHHENY